MSPLDGRAWLDRSSWNATAIALLVLFSAAVLVGGASRLNELRVAVAELAALPAMVLASRELLRRGAPTQHRFLLMIAGVMVLIPIIQLVPLPPGIWTSLPGRADAALSLQVAGLAPGWMPMSLTPDRTFSSWLALIPPMAALLAMLVISRETRQRFAVLLLLSTTFSIVLGAAQLASGGDRLYAWPTTDVGSVVGLFANRNHLATLCLASIPFAFVLGAGTVRRNASRRSGLWLAAFFVGLAVIALGAIKSRMGIILVAPVLAASVFAAWVALGRGRPRPLLLVLVSASAVAFAAVAVFALAPIISRFDTSGSPEGRLENWPLVIEAAGTYLPVGSGSGSFDAVYRSVEPLERLDATYFNQAHNDYLEVWLETGWMGAIALALFLTWFARRAWAAWSARASTDRDIQRAATIGIGVILLHSGADYPLRTLTIATLLAFFCGLLEFAGLPDPDSTRRRRT